MNLNQVTIPALDIEVSTQFYLRLGFVNIVKTPQYARFECPKGDSTFSLFLSTKPSDGLTTIYFEEENLDEWVETLKRKGFKFDQDLEDKKYLWREAILHDPAGNKIKLFWAGKNRKNPPWRKEIKG